MFVMAPAVGASLGPVPRVSPGGSTPRSNVEMTSAAAMQITRDYANGGPNKMARDYAGLFCTTLVPAMRSCRQRRSARKINRISASASSPPTIGIALNKYTAP